MGVQGGCGAILICIRPAGCYRGFWWGLVMEPLALAVGGKGDSRGIEMASELESSGLRGQTGKILYTSE
jgi:hypothetical protein